MARNAARRGLGGLALAACLVPGALAVGGCTRDGRYQPLGMWNDARLKPYEASPMAGEVALVREPPPGTVARGQMFQGDPIYTGRSANGQLLRTAPIPITPEVLRRGQEQFNVHCSPCHGRLGDGMGMIVQRGFPHPPDYAIRRLRNAPIGHFYDVITNGYGVMYSYAERVPVPDRWAIAAYIRVLQQARPEVPEDRFRTERERARETGIRQRPRPGAPAGSRAPAGPHEGEAAPAPAAPEAPSH